MFDGTDKLDQAVAMHERVIKGSSASCKAYTRYALFHYRRKQFKEARAILARANKQLPKRKGNSTQIFEKDF